MRSMRSMRSMGRMRRMRSMGRIRVRPWIALALALAGVSAPAQRLYWREPQAVLGAGVRFPTVVARGDLVVAAWQEMVAPRLLGGGGEIRLSLATSRDLRQWRTTPRFAGPYAFPREEAALYSLAVGADEAVYVAILSGPTEVTLMRSRDGGQSFQTAARLDAGATVVAPTLSVTDSGRLLLFVNRERDRFLDIYYAVSADGASWSDFRPLVTDRGPGGAPALNASYLPHHVSMGGREYVVYQGIPGGGRFYQLYIQSSGDGGQTWGPGREISFPETLDGEALEKGLFNNQRPFLCVLDGKLGLAWERQLRTNPARIYYAELDSEGAFLLAPEAVTEGATAGQAPRVVRYKDGIRLFWSDKSRGENQVFLGERQATRWQRTQLSVLEGDSMAGASYFPQPVARAEQLYVFWENRVGQTSRLYFLEPDQAVAAPTLQAASYRPGGSSREEAVRYTWRYPSDSSGIAGASYVWSKDPAAPVPKQFPLVLPPADSVSVRADSDGTWHFRLAVQDYAGNWSETVALSYRRDTVPPEPPTLDLPPTDAEGFLVSNSFTVRWLPDPAEAPVGYSYALEYLGDAPPPAALGEPVITPRVMTELTEVSYRNRDDGSWRFSVAALDGAGNVGRPATAVLRLNKYQPETIGTYVTESRGPLGDIRLSIGGRGFTAGGAVTQVVLDRDGQAPYDYTLGSDRFRVVDDRLIRDVEVRDVEPGVYRIGVVHPVRGVAFTPSQLSVEAGGTVKIGDFSYRYQSPWRDVRRPSYLLSMNELAVWLALAFLGIGLLLTARRLAAVLSEGRVLHTEVLAVLRGEKPLALPGRGPAQLEELRKKGMGLRLKFTILIMILVLITVLMVSVPLGFYMVRTERETLTEGLLARATVLLDSITSNATSALQRNADYELLDLPDAQVKSMAEARFITVTGRGTNDRSKFDYIWGTNDPEIQGQTLAGNFDRGSPGSVRLNDALARTIGELEGSVNQRARNQVSSIVSERQRILTEVNTVARREGIDSPRFAELQRQLNELDSRIAGALREVGAEPRSSPEFDPQRLQERYVFYRPIVFRQEGEDIYFRGAVRMGVSTENIQSELKNATRTLLIQTGVIALIAAGLGLVGAIIMASITINPIKKLAAGVTLISETEDKEKLKDHVIQVKTRDEIGALAATVNQMTQGLVKAAKASKDLTMGKDLQRMFLPLEPDPQQPELKLATAREVTPQIELFGYYEGAKGVSGDYFEFRKLDARHYAIIKCDVSGKGVSASLIMVGVATIFSAYFRNWTLKSKGMKLDELAYQINDMVNERGFKGRFAAFTLAILDAETGRLWLCHAGDKDQHIYRQASRKLLTVELPTAPAAGPLDSDMVRMQSGYRQVEQQLARGDILFLYTDGMEENRRALRDAAFRMAAATEEERAEAERQGVKLIDEEGLTREEMGAARNRAVVEAVLGRGEFELVKWRNPIPEEKLQFDFSGGGATVEEAVLALIAVDKIFRLVPDPAAGPGDRVQVDTRVADFLKKHFRQYPRYFAHPVTVEEQRKGTLVFSHLREDDQYDDLTILAVHKK